MMSPRVTRASLPAAILLGIVLTALLVPNSSVVAEDCAGTPTVTTDKDEYEHGETVFMFGSGFECEATLIVKISAPDGSVTSTEVTTDSTGEFTLAYQLDSLDGVFRIEVLDADQAILAETTIAILSHFRYGTLSWSPTGKPREPGESGEVRFRLRAAFRRDAYSGSRCIPVGCSGSDGRPVNGDIIIEEQGPTQFNFGDGSSITGTLRFLITGHNTTENWVIGEALTIHPDGTSEIGILHTYPDTATDTFTAYLAGFANVPPLTNVACCRIGQFGFGTTPPLNNRAGLPYPLQTEVKIHDDPLLGNSSPVSGLPPIVSVPQSTAATFNVPATDPDNDTVTFRMATDAEAGGCCQPPGMSIDSMGKVTWNNLTSGPSGSTLDMANFWTAQVIVEDGKTKTPVDFLLKIVLGNPPAFIDPTPEDGKVFKISVGEFKSIPLKAQDPDPGDTVSLNHAGIPPAAVFTPGGVANPVEGSFQWTPQEEDEGTITIVCFTATDNHGVTSPPRCFVIEVTQDSDGDGIEDTIDGVIIQVQRRDITRGLGTIELNTSRYHSNTFTDQLLGGVTSGVIWDGMTLTRQSPQVGLPYFGNQPLGFPHFGNRSEPIDSVVVHYCDDTFRGCIQTLDERNLSAHYVTSEDGKIVQLVSDESRAFHATYYNHRSIGIEQEGSGDYNDTMYESLANLIVKLLTEDPNILAEVEERRLGLHPTALARPLAEGESDPSLDSDGCLNVPGLVGHNQVQPDRLNRPDGRIFGFDEYFEFAELCGFLTEDGTAISTKSDPGSNFNWSRLLNIINQRFNNLRGPHVSVVDVLGETENGTPRGVRLDAIGGEGGPASVVACDRVLRLTEGDSVIITCESLVTEVHVGPIEILLGENVVVTVPSATTVTITEITEGEFQIENSPGSEGVATVQINGQELFVGPGETVNIKIVDIDTKPGSDPNCIKVTNKGSIPVAILATTDLDVNTIDPSTVLIDTVVPLVQWSTNKDVSGDGLPDFVGHFSTPALNAAGLLIDGVTLSLFGALFDGTPFSGSDTIFLAGGPNCN